MKLFTSTELTEAAEAEDIANCLFAAMLALVGRPDLALVLAEDSLACFALRREHRARWHNVTDFDSDTDAQMHQRLRISADDFANAYSAKEAAQ